LTRVLVDAHALLWWLDDDARLSRGARQIIEDAHAPLLGAGTLVEIALKRSTGKLPIDADWLEQARVEGFVTLDIAQSHVTLLQDLPYPEVGGRVHRDPFDRLLAAQALDERIAVVTRDPALAAYGIGVLW
jgi:PIN domain nuclease of toxin-antitoxin system